MKSRSTYVMSPLCVIGHLSFFSFLKDPSPTKLCYLLVFI
jgi:hypothetical protein